VTFTNLTAGIVGVGFIGVAHAEALRRLGVRIGGVVGSSPDRTRAKAEAAGLPHVHDSLEAMLEDAAIDVVHVASPNHVHAEQVLAALDAGKHVVCEKPLGLDSGQTAQLVAAAEASGRVHAVCFNVRFYPLCQQMHAMVAGDELGPPRFVTGSYLQDWLLETTDWNWRVDPAQGGRLRAVADIGSHWLDLARFVTGRRIVEVMADLHTFVPVRSRPEGSVETFAAGPGDEALVEVEVGSDDAAGILLRFEDGTRGSLAVSQVSAGRKNAIEIEVDGERSAVSWFSEDPDRLWIGHRGRPNEVLQRDAGLVAPEVRDTIGYPGGHVEGYPDTFRALFARVYADIARGGPSEAPTYPTFHDGHDAVVVTEAIATSAQTGRWTPVER
jgi:predicted dehydrogenase